MNNAMDTIHWAPLMDEAFFAGKSLHQLTVESPIKNTLYGTAYGEGVMMSKWETLCSIFYLVKMIV